MDLIEATKLFDSSLYGSFLGEVFSGERERVYAWIVLKGDCWFGVLMEW